MSIRNKTRLFRDGTTYYGILDPSTGKPVETDLVSVTVTHADGPTSDALAPCLVWYWEKKRACPC